MQGLSLRYRRPYGSNRRRLSKDSKVSALKIVPYSNEKQQVVNLLVELQEYLVSADEERVQTIDDEYGEKYFT